MARTTVVRRVEPPRRRRGRDWLLVAGAAIILAFAVVGIVSAASYLGGAMATSHSKKSAQTSSSGSSLALQAVARARAQATAIVEAAQTAGQQIISGDTRKAHKQVATIISAAHRSSAQATTASPPSAPAAPSASAGTTSSAAPAPGTSTYGGTTSTGSTYPGTSSGTSSSTSTGTAQGSATSSSPSTPDLSGVPASWLVVAYNATFGSGPGSAGSISVINRSGSTFSGVAQVDYIGSGGVIGSASAPFSSLAPGQSEVLPLNGMVYPSGATTYRIEVVNVH